MRVVLEPAWVPGLAPGLPPPVSLIVFVGVGFSIALHVGLTRWLAPRGWSEYQVQRPWPAPSWRSSPGPMRCIGFSTFSGFDTANWGAEVRVPYCANPSTPPLLPVPATQGTRVVLHVEEL